MNLIKRAIHFFKNSYYEFTKVIWLGKKEVVVASMVVFVFVIVMSIFVSIVDLFLSAVVGIIL
ncbi:MAG: preprotein translocase subunit SecE [Endomicrobium sp.]|jgi:preprotein translocase subunit SecE|nr:preprotein translocase subunit SecE [Endomicrobium sp.]